ncbi:MAG: hypothetical protein RL215_412 [Planctomycetota bacterium]
MFESDGESDGFFCDPCGRAGSGCHRCVAHGGGEGDERFDAAEGFSDVEESGVHADAFGDGSAVADIEGEHGAEAFLLVFCEFVLWV